MDEYFNVLSEASWFESALLTKEGINLEKVMYQGNAVSTVLDYFQDWGAVYSQD